MQSSDKLSVKDFRFGIELELGIDIDDFLANVTILPGWRAHDEHCGSELVSPRLIGFAGLFAVRRQLKEIHSTYKKVNFFDAGLHVHVDIQHFTLGNTKNLLRLASIFDEVIFAFMDGSRYKNMYANHCNYKLHKIDKCITFADIQALQSHGRYHGLNLHAFPKHGTVEFRYAMATADWTKIYSIISMYLRMVAFAGANKSLPKTIYLPPNVNSSGPKFSKERLASLTAAKDKFLDLLQISGDVRVLLDSMFDKNALDTVKPDKKASYNEQLKPIRGLKQKRKVSL